MGKKNIWPKKIKGPKKFQARNFFGSYEILGPKNLGLKQF